jgi:hypothetical protein
VGESPGFTDEREAPVLTGKTPSPFPLLDSIVAKTLLTVDIRILVDVFDPGIMGETRERIRADPPKT